MSNQHKKIMKEFYGNNKGLFGITFFAMIIIGGMNLFGSFLLQQLTDIAMGNELKPLLQMIGYTGIMISVFLVASMIQRYTYSRFVTNSIRKYKNYVFKELAKKSIHSFQGENTSKYISTLTNDATVIEESYMRSIFSLIEKGISFFGALALMIWYSPTLTIVAVVLTIIPIMASLACANKMAQVEKAVSDQNEQFVGTVKDILSGFSVIKSFNAEDVIRELYEKENRSLEENKYHKYMTQELVSIIGGAASIIAQMGVFIAGAYLAITGKGVTPGIVIVFVQLMNYVVEPISTVPTILGKRKAAKTIMSKIWDALCKNVQESGVIIGHKLEKGIRFENVSFGYSEINTVLHDLNFELESGKSYALVGGSGSGKSTLLNLLMGSFPYYNGSIVIDNVELKDIQSDSLFNLISIVQQNVFVFNNSIRDNITMFKEFDEEKVNRAISLSGLSTLLEKKGENYLCGENGCSLSGGERQRISIARCLLRETPVLLVDEATASLDVKTAFDVTNSILKIKGLTRIVATHGLEESLLKQYDKLIVLKNGIIHESGSFEQLIKGKGYFYSLYNVAN